MKSFNYFQLAVIFQLWLLDEEMEFGPSSTSADMQWEHLVSYLLSTINRDDYYLNYYELEEAILSDEGDHFKIPGHSPISRQYILNKFQTDH